MHRFGRGRRTTSVGFGNCREVVPSQHRVDLFYGPSGAEPGLYYTVACDAGTESDIIKH